MFITQLISRIRHYLAYRESVRTLSALNDRELADIGVNRGDIQSVARRGAMA
ncbi:MAG: DUF1127 domain-containing protein [Beijerinckiaceae bacterium]